MLAGGAAVYYSHVMSFINTRRVRRFDVARLCKNNLFETPQMFCDVYCLEPGQSQQPHTHAGATKFYFVIEGCGEFLVGEQRESLVAGGLAWAGPGEVHGVENRSDGPLVLLVTMSPNPNSPTTSGQN